MPWAAFLVFLPPWAVGEGPTGLPTEPGFQLRKKIERSRELSLTPQSLSSDMMPGFFKYSIQLHY